MNDVIAPPKIQKPIDPVHGRHVLPASVVRVCGDQRFHVSATFFNAYPSRIEGRFRNCDHSHGGGIGIKHLHGATHVFRQATWGRRL